MKTSHCNTRILLMDLSENPYKEHFTDILQKTL